ncbi:hypothetical protein ACFOFO_16015 [Undibacterium arcticum]|uniref:Uncharacterized protein n=2 Tax=Undibacterium arcticum TaxID=1762892 RepID=A0ABV7F2Z5_9BURK
MMLDIAWYRRYVTIKTWPVFDRRLNGAFHDAAKEFQGKFNKAKYQWEFPSSQNIFCSLAVKFAFSRGAGETKFRSRIKGLTDPVGELLKKRIPTLGSF